MNLTRFYPDEANDLQKKQGIERPWSAKEWSYATDGRVLIRIPRCGSIPENSNAPDGRHIKRLFDAYPHMSDKVVWTPLAKYERPADIECWSCKEHGKSPICPWCDGMHKIEPLITVRLGKRLLSQAYLAIVTSLGDAGDVEAAVDYGAPLTPLAWRCGEAIGLLMPCRETAFGKQTA